MLSFHKAVEHDFAAVNSLIIENLHSDVGLVENIGHYIVGSGGKRLRPVVVLLSALANGYKGKQHIAVAAVIEFIHTATLLHDDVVDVSALRRGRETANQQWGNAPSVLVGDFLYSRAFQMLVAISNMEMMGVIADATNLISEGEVQQMDNAGNAEIDEAVYNQVIYRKTAKLFESGCAIGALLAEVDSQPMREYGAHLGLAFQIMDDVLDYQGDTDLMGKNVGDDLAEGKMTLPLIYARDNCDAESRALICQAIENKSSSNFEAICGLVQAAGGLDYSRQKALEHVVKAKQAIAGLEDSVYKTVLCDIADFSVTRSD